MARRGTIRPHDPPTTTRLVRHWSPPRAERTG